jgi:hypothetical protein
MGDCLFLNKLQSDEIVLKLSSKIDKEVKILNESIKEAIKDSKASIVKNNFISIGETINVR